MIDALILVKFLISLGNIDWQFMGFYGALDERHQVECWDLLRQLGQGQVMSWLVAGDFNEIAFSSEEGGCERDEK